MFFQCSCWFPPTVQTCRSGELMNVNCLEVWRWDFSPSSVLLLCWTIIDQGPSLCLSRWTWTPCTCDVIQQMWSALPSHIWHSDAAVSSWLKAYTAKGEWWFKNARQKYTFIHIAYTDVQLNTRPSRNGAARGKRLCDGWAFRGAETHVSLRIQRCHSSVQASADKYWFCVKKLLESWMC